MNNKIFFFSFIIFLCVSNTLTVLSQETDYSKLFEDLEDDLNKDESNDNKTESAVSDEFSAPELTFGINGEQEFEFHFPIIPGYWEFTGPVKAPRFNNNFGIDLIYDNLKVTSNWQFNIILNEWDDWQKLIQVYYQENYIQWTPWKFNFQVGLIEYAWGSADNFNPTDNLNARDLTQGPDAVKIPALSGAVRFFPMNLLSMELVYIPYKQASLFPVDLTGQIPGQVFNSKELQFNTSNPNKPISRVISHDKNIVKYDLALDPANFVLGTKVNLYHRYFDFSLSYVYDWDAYYTPVINLNKESVIMRDYNGIPGNDIAVGNLYRVKSIDLTYKRLHQFGLDFKTNADRFGIWLEIGYSLSEDYLLESDKIRNHKLAWTAGFDFNYGPDQEFYANFQYLGEFIPGYYLDFYNEYDGGLPDPDDADDEDYMEQYYYRAFTDKLGGAAQGLLQGLSVRMEWPLWNDLMTPNLVILYLLPLVYDYEQEGRFGSLMINPELDFMPIDSLHICLGAELFYAWHQPKDENVQINYSDRLGRFHKDSNIYLAVRYKWDMEWSR